MAKDVFGTVIPSPRDIVAIEGENVIDKDGDVTSTKLVKLNQEVGGGYTLVEWDKEKPSKKRMPATK